MEKQVPYKDARNALHPTAFISYQLIAVRNSFLEKRPLLLFARRVDRGLKREAANRIFIEGVRLFIRDNAGSLRG